jgi:hypothetical protein
MLHNAIVLALITPALFIPPQPPDPPNPPESAITIPAGPIPWTVPVLPAISLDLDIDEPVFDEVAHTEDYAANIASIESRFTDESGVSGDAAAEFDTWLGIGGLLPDMSAGADFETGISTPGYTDTSAYEIATELGENIGTMFAYIRALASFDAGLGGISTLIAFVILCIAWMALIIMLKFAIQFVDMLFSVAVKIIELIPVVE